MLQCEKATHISKCLELAILLEVSADKPGNVNLVVGFDGTRVEHFLASAVAARASLEEAAKRGIDASNRKIRISEAGIGELIKKCAADIEAWQKGGNTLIGTVMLFVPLAVAAGMTPMKNGNFNFSKLRTNLKVAIESTTPQDAVYLYEAIDIAKPGGLDGAPDLDVRDPNSKKRLLKEQISLFQVFKIAAGYDDICFEWVNNYPITFDLAYPYLIEQLKSRDLNTAIIHTFLKVLSERPDTFIARKVGLKKAKEVSVEAAKVLRVVGTEKGKELILLFDRKLREQGNDYNPGTTADITAATLALATLSGYRP
jgi:triphosphoribosyl-dephospho-CoA synthase